ncbi:MAG: hypothetical protein ACFFG0_28360 [Candidatus Thorarchaeota archaeon]
MPDGRLKLESGRRLIPERYYKGSSLEEYTKIWDDSCIPGTLFALHNFSSKKYPLTDNMVSEIIGFKRGSVKNARLSLLKNEALKDAINTFKLNSNVCKTDRSKLIYYLNCEVYKKMNFDFFKRLVLSAPNIKNSNEPNFCEESILEICNELYPESFIFTGAQLEKNKIINIYGKAMYPDISSIKFPIVLEHFGSPYHCGGKKEELERIERYKELNMLCKVIWDYTPRNRNKIKNEIEEFVENAIQNIHKLVV